MSESKVKLRYVGPPQQACYELGRHGYKTACVVGQEYLLPEGIASRLVSYSASWERVEAVAVQRGRGKANVSKPDNPEN